MSFAASTVPGSKHQFLSTNRKGGTQKRITPRGQQQLTMNQDGSRTETGNASTSHRTQKQTKTSRVDDIDQESHKKKEKKNAVGEKQKSSDNETTTAKEQSRPVSADVDGELETVAGNDIWITSKSKYDEMVFLRQRHELRIQNLETDLQEVLQYYEMLYKENEILKEKLNVDEQLVAEPYKIVYNDRGVLRTAEFMYKKRIAQLQKEVKEKDMKIQELKDDNKRLKSKLPNIEKEKEKEAKYNRMFWENRDLRTENHNLLKKIGILSEDIKFYKTQKIPDWDGFFVSTSTGESLLHKVESVYGKDQYSAIIEHEAKKLIAELEESVETLTMTVENLTAANKSITKTNKEIKRGYDDAVRKCEEFKTEKYQLERDIKLLNYRLGENKSSKLTDKTIGKHDYAKILKRFKDKV